MKIISKIKDYYDYVPHLYGGGDPKIIYDRRRIGEQNDQGITSSLVVELPKDTWPGFRFPFDKVIGFDDSRYSGSSVAEWLIVCGKPYPLIPLKPKDNSHAGINGWSTYGCDWIVFDPVKHAHLVTYSWDSSKVTLIGKEHPGLVKLSTLIGHPIFRITRVDGNYKSNNRRIYVDGNYPILNDLGFATIYPAEQLYQDLSYFIVNKMKTSPDMQPPTPSTDKEKIKQHGFDVKQSFRHRK